ncbi:hypothetical protein N8724_00385 [Candidatus Pelagibacter sp.]|nr:hypothetical protein [Candidatus Pelagibacter sp.]
MKKFLITFFISFIAFAFSSTISFALEGECVEDSSGNIVISVNGRAATQDRVEDEGTRQHPFTYSDNYADEGEEVISGGTFARHCNNQPDFYKVKFYKAALCTADPYVTKASPDYSSCTDIFSNASGKDIIIQPNADTDLIDQPLVIPLGSYPYLAVVVDNHLKIKHTQKYVYENSSDRVPMHGFGETGNATNKDTCYTLDKVTTYTNLLADGVDDNYPTSYATAQGGVTILPSGNRDEDTSLLKCVSDTSRTGYDYATEIIDQFGEDNDYTVAAGDASIDYEEMTATGLSGLEMAATMMKTNNVSIATAVNDARRIGAFFKYANPVNISENTIGFKLNFATTVAVSLDASQNEDTGDGGDGKIWISKVGADPFTIQVQTKTRRTRGTWR